jgi:ParB family transcriptional regulator, chromosome partitioning protein
MTRKALGRGLSALLSDSSNGINNPPAYSISESKKEELRDIDIDLIDPNPQQPRTNFTEDKLAELAQSIKENGLVQPILLRRKDNGRYQIIAGERRWRASQVAGLQRISSIIREMEDDRILEVALIENIQRQELNPIEEALAYQRLVSTLNLTQEEVAKRVGKDRSSVANYVRLLKLPENVQKMVETEMISMGHARAILGLESQELQSRLAQEIVDKKMSVRETERAVQQKAISKSEGETDSTVIRNDANIRAAELKLKRFLGTQVKIQISSKGGKISIDFSSANELDRIYSILMRRTDVASQELSSEL